ncbi:MAG: hypothetical protein JKY65_31815 [Planctomycetes bacterium]|nr:hypothetical protein [Planctomycetota bacterium]
MRVTQNQRTSSSLRDIQSAAQQLSTLEEQVSSGTRIRRPSDDPIVAGRLLTLDAEQGRLENSERMGQLLGAELEVADSALQALSAALARARALGVAGGSDALNSTDRASLAVEVDGILQEALGLSNRTLDGRSIFAGGQTNLSPYELQAGPPQLASYAGDGLTRSVAVGDILISATPAGPEPMTAALNSLIALRDALRTDASSTRAALDGIDSAHEGTTLSLAKVGTRQGLLQRVDDEVDVRILRLLELRSELADVDLSEAIVSLREHQVAYERGLQVVARILQVSILSYL